MHMQLIGINASYMYKLNNIYCIEYQCKDTYTHTKKENNKRTNIQNNTKVNNSIGPIQLGTFLELLKTSPP